MSKYYTTLRGGYMFVPVPDEGSDSDPSVPRIRDPGYISDEPAAAPAPRLYSILHLEEMSAELMYVSLALLSRDNMFPFSWSAASHAEYRAASPLIGSHWADGTGSVLDGIRYACFFRRRAGASGSSWFRDGRVLDESDSDDASVLSAFGAEPTLPGSYFNPGSTEWRPYMVSAFAAMGYERATWHWADGQPLAPLNGANVSARWRATDVTAVLRAYGYDRLEGPLASFLTSSYGSRFSHVYIRGGRFIRVSDYRSDAPSGYARAFLPKSATVTDREFPVSVSGQPPGHGYTDYGLTTSDRGFAIRRFPNEYRRLAESPVPCGFISAPGGGGIQFVDSSDTDVSDSDISDSDITVVTRSIGYSLAMEKAASMSSNPYDSTVYGSGSVTADWRYGPVFAQEAEFGVDSSLHARDLCVSMSGKLSLDHLLVQDPDAPIDDLESMFELAENPVQPGDLSTYPWIHGVYGRESLHLRRHWKYRIDAQAYRFIHGKVDGTGPYSITYSTDGDQVKVTKAVKLSDDTVPATVLPVVVQIGASFFDRGDGSGLDSRSEWTARHPALYVKEVLENASFYVLVRMSWAQSWSKNSPSATGNQETSGSLSGMKYVVLQLHGPRFGVEESGQYVVDGSTYSGRILALRASISVKDAFDAVGEPGGGPEGVIGTFLDLQEHVKSAAANSLDAVALPEDETSLPTEPAPYEGFEDISASGDAEYSFYVNVSVYPFVFVDGIRLHATLSTS